MPSDHIVQKGLYASVVNASEQVNCTNNEGFNSGVQSGTTHFMPEVTKKINFRSLINEERVDNYDTVLPMAAMENVKKSMLTHLLVILLVKASLSLLFKTYTHTHHHLQHHHR